MKRIKGIYQNCDPVDQPEGYYRDAENIILDDKLGTVEVEYLKKEKDYNNISSLLEGKNVIHVFEYNEEKLIAFYVEGGVVYIYDENTEESVNSTVSGYTGGDIQTDVYYNNFNQRVIVYIIGSSPAYIYNTDTKSVNTLFPVVENLPKISSADVNNFGGNLPAGSYYVAIAYRSVDNILTEFFDVRGPFFVTSGSPENDDFSGDPSSFVTGKSLQLNFGTADPNYISYIVAIIPILDGVIGEVKILPEISTSQPSYSYSGNESYTPGALSEIQIAKAYYENPKALHIQDNIIYLGNLSKPDYSDIQSYVNNAITVVPDSLQDSNQYYIETNNIRKEISYSGSLRTPEGVLNKAGYKRGEVYALYISFLLKTGGETPAFHIPGRIAEGTEATEGGTSTYAQKTLYVSPDQPYSGNLTVSFGYFGGSSTIDYSFSSTGSASGFVTNLVAKINLTSSFPFSASDTGSNSFTLTAKQAGVEGENGFTWSMSEDAYRIGESIGTGTSSGSIQILRTITEGYKLSSVGSSATQMGFWQNSNEIYDSDFPDFAGQKVRHHHFPEAEYIPLQSSAGSINHLGFKLQFNETLLPDSIKNNLLGYKVYYAKRDASQKRILDQAVLITGKNEAGDLVTNRRYPNTDSGFTPNYYYCHPFYSLSTEQNLGSISHIKNIAQGSLSNASASNLSLNNEDINYIPSNHVHTSAINPAANKYFSVKDIAYITENSIVDIANFNFSNNTFDNTYGEKKVLVEINSTSNILGSNTTYLTDLLAQKNDVYNSYNSQILVHTGYTHTDTTDLNSSIIFGGDTFVTNYVWKAYDKNDLAVVSAHSALVESPYNLNYRSSDGPPYQSFFPNLSLVNFLSIAYSEGFQATYTQGEIFHDNYYGYNKSFVSDNIFKFPTIFTTKNPVTTSFSNRVIRSIEGQGVSFLQNDYLDLPSKRGEIKRIDSFNNSLIIHTEKALFRTKGKEQLVTNELQAFVGSGDIFAVKPEELVYSNLGVGGIKTYSQALSTNFGYFFYDENAKKVYVLQNQGIKDITDSIKPIIKNLNNLFDFSWAEDIERGRVFFKAGDLILSYSSKIDNWISRHHWFSQNNLLFISNRQGLFLYNTNENNLYSILESFDGSENVLNYNSSFSFIENQEPTEVKEFVSLSIQGDKEYTKHTIDLEFPNDPLKVSSENKIVSPFNRVTVSSKRQTSNATDLVDFDIKNPYIQSVRKVLGNWNINNVRDTEDKRIRGNYLEIKLENISEQVLSVGVEEPTYFYPNEKIYISDIITNYKKPNR